MNITPLAAFGWEFFGTSMFLLFGLGVNATVTLRTSSAREVGGLGWLQICFGWGFGVFTGASIAHASGGYLNPAITLWSAINGHISWSLVPFYVTGELLGAMFGAVLVYLAYKQLFDHHGEAIPGSVFFTRPAHGRDFWNFITEFIGTTTLVAFIAFGPNGGTLGSLTYVGAAFVIMAIGFSLGAPTNCAINPARDLGPRLIYAFILPFQEKESASWRYAWVPILSPLSAGLFVGLLDLLV